MKKLKTLILAACLSSAVYAQSGWKIMHPGAGGRVQGLACDPDEPGVMYSCSDMEGFYRSSNYGESWSWMGKNAISSNTLTVAAAKGSPRIFIGATKCMTYSDDGGKTIKIVTPTLDEAIGVITVDPFNPKYVYAGQQAYASTPAVASGTRRIFVSSDGGNTFTSVTFVNGDGDKNISSIIVHPVSGSNNNVVLAAISGIYTSSNFGTTWSSVITPPSGTGDCTGADISPDGNWLYAMYAVNGATVLYVKKNGGSPASPNWTANSWQNLGFMNNGNVTGFHQPKVWRGSTTTHYVMYGQLQQGPNDGLYEARFTPTSGTTVTPVAGGNNGFFKIMNVYTRNNAGFDVGPYDLQPNCRHNEYWPLEWRAAGGTTVNWTGMSVNKNGSASVAGANFRYTRGVIVMSQHVVLVGDAADVSNNNTPSWNVQSSTTAKVVNGVNFFKTNGTASTLTWDVDGYKNYVIQGQADNGPVESYDGGETWENNKNLPTAGHDAHGVCVVPPRAGNTERPLVLVSHAGGYGGANSGSPDATGAVSYKLLDLTGNTDTWAELCPASGDINARKGFPVIRAWAITYDPLKPERVYFGSTKGLYVTDDIRGMIAGGTQRFRLISDASYWCKRIVVDPTNSNIVYMRCSGGSFKGTRDNAGNYTWTPINAGGTTGLNSSGNTPAGDISVTQHNGKNYVFVTKSLGSNHELYFSVDGGAFTKVLDRTTAFGILNPPADWISSVTRAFTLSTSLVHKNYVYVLSYSDTFTEGGAFARSRKGYGVLRGTIQPNNTITWEDWSGVNGDDNIVGLYFTYARCAKVWVDGNGKDQILVATHGMGAFSRLTDGLMTSSEEANLSDKSGLVVYPCPARGTVNLSTQASIKTIELFNENGQSVYQGQGTTLDVSSFPEGLYLLMAETSEGRITKKLSVIK